MDMLRGSQIAGAGLTDWRKLAQGVHARYLVADFAAGARFVAAVVPHVIDACLDDSAPAFRITWTGPLEAALAAGVKLSHHASAAGPFSLTMKRVGG